MAENQENRLNEEEQVEITVEKKLVALYTLQQIDSKIDKIRIIRGELPEAVQDLEDEIEGLKIRIEKIQNEIDEFQKAISDRKWLALRPVSQIIIRNWRSIIPISRIIK